MPATEVFNVSLRHFLAPVAAFLDDEGISEIMINGPREVYVERDGTLLRTDAAFASAESLMAAVRNIAEYAGLTLRAEDMRFDGSLPGGHRVHVVLPPVARHGVSLTIRKHTMRLLSAQSLVERRVLSAEALEYLTAAVLNGRNLLVSGGTGTGKTTLLNVLSGIIPAGARILVLEDTAELQLQQEHVVSLVCKPPDRKGNGAVSIRDLLHSTLRMRPDRIVVGECRGGEAFDLLQALNTGHDGSMSTIHANSPREALGRLESLALLAGFDVPVQFLRSQVAAAIHVVVQLQRLAGSRMVQAIMGVEGLDDRDRYAGRDVFSYDPRAGCLVRQEGGAGGGGSVPRPAGRTGLAAGGWEQS
jgi:pilus assembly protein CpaF